MAKFKRGLTEAEGVLVVQNMRLVGWYMKRLSSHLFDNDPEAFEQELYLALIKAVQSFDARLGSFTTHALWQFRAALSCWMASKSKHFGVRSLTGEDLDTDVAVVENVELEKFRECLLSLSPKEKSVFPFGRRYFGKRDKSLRRGTKFGDEKLGKKVVGKLKRVFADSGY